MAVLDWLQSMLGGGDPEAEQNAQASTAMQPSVLQHLKDAIGDVPGRFSGQSYDPSQSFAQNALNPQGIDQATTIAMMAGPGAIRAYHGSPHSFDRFDASKIGTGEGAQAYGHGLYFAEAEPVAKGYRDALSALQPSEIVSPAGEPVAAFRSKASLWGQRGDLADKLLPPSAPDAPLGWMRSSAVGAWLNNDFKPPNAPQIMRQAFGEGWERHSADPMVVTEAERLAERAKGLEGYSVRQPGHMYEVNLHADPEAFLNWDKPLSQHGEAARKILADNWLAHPIDHANQTGGQIYESSRIVPGEYRDPAAASAALKDAGIPGIRYLDQGSRGAGQGTSNYVMFDPAKIEILRKYGIIPPVAGAGLLADQQ